jgi:hypothetical protein
VREDDGEHVAVTFDHCEHVLGPFFHGTIADLAVGDLLTPGRRSNFRVDQVMNHIYFAAEIETAVWGAELARALADSGDRGRVYVVEPLGPFEDDPNVTNKRFPGNPTRSYRSRDPLRVGDEVVDWPGHDPAVLESMLQSLARLREQGLDVIED